ncbi:MAG: hemolysin family protein [Tenericutes bacterium]|nr:hemolysin family protein [Mycoplasmatota bacterium]
MVYNLLLLIILIAINGIFSASELAFLKINKYELKNKIKIHDKKAIQINKILSDQSAFLSTIQISITLAGFLASAFAADYFADYFLQIINISFISSSTLRTILVIIITFILSYVTLIFGELVPKKIAINNPYKIACLFIGLISFVKTFFSPLIKLLTLSTNFICKIFKIKENEDKITEDEIKKIILLGNTEGVIEEKEKDYILNIFNFNDIEVGKIMTKKEDVVMININDDMKNILSTIKESKYTRFPVYDKNEIIGILNVKDFILNYNELKDLRSIVRTVNKYEYTEKIDDVFRMMQKNNESISLIYNKKEMVGIVTIEDAIEEIVGNIFDEYDGEKKYEQI